MAYTNKVNHVPSPLQDEHRSPILQCLLRQKKGLNCSKKDTALKGSETLEQVKKGYKKNPPVRRF